jgi:hypothetical protein
MASPPLRLNVATFEGIGSCTCDESLAAVIWVTVVGTAPARQIRERLKRERFR